MTDLLSPSASQRRSASDGRSASAAAPSSPVALRLRQRRWREPRILLGVLLILVSVVVGARVVASSRQTGSWVAVRTALPAGHVLTDADLVAVPAHLSAAAGGHYFQASSRGRLVGHPLTRPLTGGELLPRGAVQDDPPPPARIVPVVVRPGHLPPLSPGDHVDVYVLSKTGDGSRETRVLNDVEYLSGDVLGNGDTSARLRIDPADAAAAVAASQAERVDLVKVEQPPNRSVDPGPSSVPGFGG